MAEPGDLLSDDEHNAVLNGLATAYEASIAASGVEAPWRVDIEGPSALGGRRVLPGAVLVAPQGMMGAGGASTVEVAEHCDAETLRICELINTDVVEQQGEPWHGRGPFEIDNLAMTLAYFMNDENEERLVLLHFGSQDALELARQELGDDRVAPFVPAVAVEAEAAAREADDEAGRAALRPAARSDRDALEAWVRSYATEHATRIAHEIATPAFQLLVPPEGAPRPSTRLYGPPLLPPEVPWPMTKSGRALTFLAVVDLAELRPTLPDGPAFPSAGWLLFYADIGPETPGQDGWYGEPTANAEGAGARVLWVPAEAEPVAVADPPKLPGGGPVRPADPRVARQELSLLDSDALCATLGLFDWEECRDVETVAADFHRGGGYRGIDWACGGVVGTGSGLIAASVLLLRLETVQFQDGGTIQFRIPADALAARDWSKVFAVGDSL